ncbi:uncharacterized protein LOC111065295 isoform X1 [Drosophila obscura]|uniref:uncharacterized protein LOC111065295 isoform X1 n=1 Tax=Drosophila obscura TaxID=7282 RepID=UPI001BB0FFAF|nr:uncharacterized protein LOC111065295 isoform X1 [Drosophila obscura]
MTNVQFPASDIYWRVYAVREKQLISMSLVIEQQRVQESFERHPPSGPAIRRPASDETKLGLQTQTLDGYIVGFFCSAARLVERSKGLSLVMQEHFTKIPTKWQQLSVRVIENARKDVPPYSNILTIARYSAHWHSVR